MLQGGHQIRSTCCWLFFLFSVRILLSMLVFTSWWDSLSWPWALFLSLFLLILYSRLMFFFFMSSNFLFCLSYSPPLYWLEQILPSVPWYKERRLNHTSLGSLMVIILIRTLKYNLCRLQVHIQSIQFQSIYIYIYFIFGVKSIFVNGSKALFLL